MTEEADSLLALDFGVTRYSARGLTQSLDHIEAAVQVARTVNGDLRDVSQEQFRKYKSTISCNDMKVPALGDVWPGRIVYVDCVAELAYETSTGGPSRDVVPGSSYEIEGYTHYRPRLRMMVISYTVQFDEYRQAVGWQLNLEEV